MSPSSELESRKRPRWRRIMTWILLAAGVAAQVLAQEPSTPQSTPRERPAFQLRRPITDQLMVRPLGFGEVEHLPGAGISGRAIQRMASVSANGELLLVGDFETEARIEALSLPSGRALGSVPTSGFGQPMGTSTAWPETPGVPDQESFLVISDSCGIALLRWHQGGLGLQRAMPMPPPYADLQSIRCADVAQARSGDYFVGTEEQVAGVRESLAFVYRYQIEQQRWTRKNRIGDLILSKVLALAVDPVARELVILATVSSSDHRFHVVRAGLDPSPKADFPLPPSVDGAVDPVSFAGSTVVAVREANRSWSLQLLNADGSVRERQPAGGAIRAVALQVKSPDLGALGTATLWWIGMDSGAMLHRLALDRSG